MKKLIALVFVGLIGVQYTSIAHAQAQCSGHDQVVLWSKRKGPLNDRTQYVPVKVEVERPFQNIQQVQPSEEGGVMIPTRYVEELIEGAEKKLITRVEDVTGRAYNQERYVYDFEEMRNGEYLSYEGPRDIYLTQILQITDCDRKMVVLEAAGVFSRVPRVIDGKSMLRGVVDQIPAERYITRDSNSIEINLSHFIELARTDPAVREALREGIDAFYQDPDAEHKLDYIDKYSHLLIEHVYRTGEIPLHGFETGEYGVPTILTVIIYEVVVPELKKIVARSNEPVKVISMGFTDRDAIRGSIAYGGCGLINVAVATEVPYVPESCEGSNDIRNNNQLSFARGYEGIALLHYMMGQPRYRNKLRFFYTGLGSNSPRYSKENSRRIVYKIISVNLQP